jgi:hypothetical protein
LNPEHFAFDIIEAIDKLYDHGAENTSSHNPVSALISPEWHYSDSLLVLNNTPINWEGLERFEIAKGMVESLEKTLVSDDDIMTVGAEFEKSFCSWYQPYHFLPRQKWGVHLRQDSWLRIAAIFYQNCPSTAGRKLDSIKSGFLYLYVHTLLHNIVENAASIMEILLAKSRIYTDYYSNVYSNVFNSSNCMEEALSNGYLFLWAEECHIDIEFLRNHLLKQGPGYQEFIRYDDSLNFSKGTRMLLSQILHGTLSATEYAPVEQLIDNPNPIKYSSVYKIPIWLHHKPKPVH